MIRHLKRLTEGIHEALQNDTLDRPALGLLQPYQPNLSVTWLFQKAMSVGVHQKIAPNQINQVLAGVFGEMATLGDPVLKPFLQDVVQFPALLQTMIRTSLFHPTLVLKVIPQVGLLTLLDWLVHYTNLAGYSALHPLGQSLKSWIKPLPPVPQYYLHRWIDAWQYGAGGITWNKGRRIPMDFSIARKYFYQEIHQPEEQISLEKAALYMALEEYPDLDVEAYLNALDTMAAEVEERLPREPYPLRILQTINRYLYDDLGFTGNTNDYYDPRNSFLNMVIDRRMGIPITLSLVYLAIARRIDFPMVGVGMPGHFLIRPDVEEMEILWTHFIREKFCFPRIVRICSARPTDNL